MTTQTRTRPHVDTDVISLSDGQRIRVEQDTTTRLIRLKVYDGGALIAEQQITGRRAVALARDLLEAAAHRI